MIIILSINFANAEENDSNFKLLSDERSLIEISNFHLDFLGYILAYPLVEKVPDVLRLPGSKTPGDYYRYPRGADSIQLASMISPKLETIWKKTFRGFFTTPMFSTI